MWKKAVYPLLLVLAATLLLAGIAFWYERNWGLTGPFPDEHGHAR